MQRITQQTWTENSHWHIGDLAWQRPAMNDRTIAVWPDADAWAWLSPSGDLALEAPPAEIDTVLAWAGDRAQTVSAMNTDTALNDALRSHGYREAEAPYFRHCLRDLDDQLPRPRIETGYRIRPIKPHETEQRAAVHRKAWRPNRIARLQIPPAETEDDRESGMTTHRYAQIAATWPYRPNLDLVAEDETGTLVASALGWLDEQNRSALLEPVGTDPAHARRGLGAAVSLACLHAMRDAGATLAKVCPRGDDAYPVPRALYHHIGFRDAARTVTYQRDAQ
jgi:predicted N-acetyltransferase YhbS